MSPLKKWVQKKGMNELKELIEPDFPRNNIIQLERETTHIIKGKLKGKDVGKPIIPCSFGKFKYRGICDATCDINMISYKMYDEIRYEVSRPEIEIIDMTIMLGNSTSMRPYGILRNVMICIGPHMYPH